MFLVATTALLLAVNLVRGDNVQLLSSASSDFSQRLYQKIALSTPNAVYSPYSIHSALAMTSLGAREETATEFNKALGLTSFTGNEAHEAYRDLITQLNSVKEVKLNTANAIFVNPSYPIQAQFVSDVQKDYLATSQNFDLAAAGGPEKKINDYVNRSTEGLIKDILPQGSIDGQTVIVLVNTIFFNGTWEAQFSRYETVKQDFFKLGGTKSTVDMMNDERYINIRRNVNGVDVAELPFRGGRFSLYIALPLKTDGITALESSLANAGSVNQFFEGLTRVRVKLSVPKFKIESTFQLNAPLQQLGLVRAFNQNTANFKGISTAGNLFITKVLHKAVIDVQEKGTVASAATVVMGGIESEPNLSFKANHPFMFFLRDKQTKEILFQGKFSG